MAVKGSDWSNENENVFQLMQRFLIYYNYVIIILSILRWLFYTGFHIALYTVLCWHCTLTRRWFYTLTPHCLTRWSNLHLHVHTETHGHTHRQAHSFKINYSRDRAGTQPCVTLSCKHKLVLAWVLHFPTIKISPPQMKVVLRISICRTSKKHERSDLDSSLIGV